MSTQGRCAPLRDVHPRKVSTLLKQFKAWVKGFYEEKWFIRDNFNKLNDTKLKFGR